MDPLSELLLLLSCMGIANFFLPWGCVKRFTWRMKLFGLIKSYDERSKTLWLAEVITLGTFNRGWFLYLLGLMVEFVLGNKCCLIYFCGLYGPILVVTRSYIERHRDIWYELWFWYSFNGLSGTIPIFELSSFTRKDIVSPKVQHIMASIIFSKSIQDMKTKFDMTIRYKIIFWYL